MNHKTKHIKYGDLEANVDVDISKLILNLWKLDITTTNSCQNNVPENWVWIEFINSSDAEQFLNIVAKEFSMDPKSLYFRIIQSWTGDESFWWKYRVSNFYCNLETKFIDDDTIEEIPTGSPQFMFSFSVRFPRSDLDEVCKRVKSFLKNKNV